MADLQEQKKMEKLNKVQTWCEARPEEYTYVQMNINKHLYSQ